VNPEPPPSPSLPPPSLQPLPPMTIDGIELIRVDLPLVRPFRTSFGTQTARDILLIRVAAEGLDGWSECVTPAAPVYSEEFTDGAALVLSDHLVPRLLADGPSVTAQDVAPRLAGLHGHRMAKAALELAILDAQLQAAKLPLAQYLGAETSRVPAGVSVGIPEHGISQLLDQVAGYLDDGYLRIKAKVEPGFDADPMEALRGHFGQQLRFQVDANAAYDPDDGDHLNALARLDQLGMVMIEQPFAADRLLDHARQARRWSTPVCLDESIHDAVRARDAIDSGAADIINIKVGRVGGILESVRVRDICRERDVPVWCGGMLESGIGRAVNVALGALPGFEFPGDTSASDRYWAEDLTEPFVLEDGHLAVPTAPGIGRTPRTEMLTNARRTQVSG
jgi:o-succinylbenzoate synthase